VVRARPVNCPRPLTVNSSDFDVLNFVLTLEHIENAFYSQGLSTFTQKDFVDAGFPAWSYGRLKQIAAHEAAHVQVLEITLGDKATKPCTYKLSVTWTIPYFTERRLTFVAPCSPYSDTKSFVALGHALEVVGKYLVISNCSVVLRGLKKRGLGIHRRIQVLQQQGTLTLLCPTHRSSKRNQRNTL